ncbi:glycosyl hydrolase catalytic core-domain-containing protein [Xylariomycetidae sp. FL2044]|nr:glycosyl hydrolase catalytic core-domain-containing protein [Xylariomycetidae sp. FL2044]
MHAKFSILAFTAAASVQGAAARNVHRHSHPKREIVWAETDTVVVTEYVTMTVTEGDEPATSTPATSSASTSSANVQADNADLFSPSTTSSTSIVVETSSAAAEGAAAASADVETYPVATPTTMITSARSSPASSSSSSEVEVPTTTEISSTTEVAATAKLPSTTSTSSAAASTYSAAPTTGTGSGKRGAAYNDATLVSALLGESKAISWAYNWGSDSGGLDAAVTYIPMLWGPAAEHSNGWSEKATTAIENGADALLSFNEPDIAAQANLTPESAATSHKEFMNEFVGKAKISAPAISSSENSDQGIDWLTQFFTSCGDDCPVDFCAAHWYGPGGSDGAQQFLDHLKAVHEACDNKPVWATEFAAESGSVDDFMTKVVTDLATDEYSFVERYSYFMLSESSLMDSSKALTSFGKIYADVS